MTDEKPVSVTLETVVDQIKDLQTSHVMLAHQVEDLQTSHGMLTDQVKDLQTSHGTLVNQVRDLQTSHGTLVNQVRDLQTSHGTLVNQVRDLQTSHGTLVNQVRGLKKSTDERFGELKADMRAQFASVRRTIARQSERDRRYFRMLAEDVRDSVRVVAEGTAHNTARLTDHENRLRKLEKH